MGTLIHNFHSVLSNFVITKKPASLALDPNEVRIIPSRNHSIKKKLRMAQIQSDENPVFVVCNVSETQPQKIIIQNNYGEKLVGLLRDTGSVEIVVLCHGLRSTKDDNTMVNLAVALEKEGISAFCFDFAGNGESEGSFQIGNYWREADDLHAVIQHLHGMKRVITAILGHSKGGDVVLLYASKYHDIHTVVNVSGRYNLERGVENLLGKNFLQRIKKDGFIDVKTRTGEVSYRVTEESLMDRLNTNVHEACLHINKDCRVLTVHGSADEIIPVEDALEFDKIIPNHKLHIIEGANHNYTAYQAELASVVLPFMKDGVQEGK